MFVGVGLQVVEDAHRPAFAKQQIHDVRADESRAAGNQCALLMCSHADAVLL